jgi:hypothetical protein
MAIFKWLYGLYNRWQIRRIDRRIDKIRRARFY